MLTRCPHRRPRRQCDTGVEQRPDEPFIQVLIEALDAYCSSAGLRFDERCLLEHLLCTADRRGRVGEVTLAGLAARLGLGPSGRRTLRVRLERLAGVGAVAWSPASGDRAGRVEVLVYRQLVRAGRRTVPGRFVQLVPGALGAFGERRRLSPDGRAVLLRLALDVDPASAQLATTTTGLAERLGVSWGRLRAVLDELQEAGAVRWAGGPSVLTLLPYRSVVRVGDQRAPSSRNRAPIPAKSRPPILFPPPERPIDDPSPFPPDELSATTVEGQGSDLVTAVAARLQPAEREALLDARDRRCVTALCGELSRRLRAGWTAEELVDAVGGPLPAAWQSPAAVLLTRTRALPEQPRMAAAEALAERSEAERAERLRREEVAGARALARNWAPCHEPDDLLGELRHRFTGEVLAAALDELVGIGGPSGAAAAEALAASGAEAAR